MPRHTADEVRTAVENSPSLTAALRRLGLRPAGGNFRTLKKLIAFYSGPRPRRRIPLAATLDTHCGRQNRIDLTARSCLHCGGEFLPKYRNHRYCSHPCGVHSKGSHDPKPHTRKVERPPFAQLISELEELGYRAVGRRYGVSDNAIRKWVRWYQASANGERG